MIVCLDFSESTILLLLRSQGRFLINFRIRTSRVIQVSGEEWSVWMDCGQNN